MGESPLRGRNLAEMDKLSIDTWPNWSQNMTRGGRWWRAFGKTVCGFVGNGKIARTEIAGGYTRCHVPL